MSPPLQFAVFSFNRGRFLRHCVESLERFAPGCSVHVLDDASDDPETQDVLRALATRHQVTVVDKSGVSKHGGLYANMQRAMETAQPEVPLCFLQDDAQLVRPVEPQDFAIIDRFFAHSPQAAFLSPAFIHRRKKARPPDALQFDADAGVYFPKLTQQMAGVHYSDISITVPSRLRAVGWQFKTTENGNELQARAHFLRLGILQSPFAMMLPLVPAFRGKRKTWALTLGERRSGCGFHPIAPMTADEVAALRARDNSRFPYVEDYLRVEGRDLPEPWRFNGLQGQRDLKWLNSIEVRVRRWVAAVTPKANGS